MTINYTHPIHVSTQQTRSFTFKFGFTSLAHPSSSSFMISHITIHMASPGIRDSVLYQFCDSIIIIIIITLSGIVQELLLMIVHTNTQLRAKIETLKNTQ